MKRRALLGHLQEHGCVSHREGGSHSIWINPQTGRKEAFPGTTKSKSFWPAPSAVTSPCRFLRAVDSQFGKNTPERKDCIMDKLVVPVEE